MPLLTISGIAVDFPKSPYKCQVDYMESVIKALNGGSNALLESPTGTGKTLCLLCATLAWQDSKRGKPVELAYSAGSSLEAAVKGGMGRSVPYTIVYATRTHSQLAQVVSELRETKYRPRMTVMGSREQLCVHEKISKLKSSVLNHACNSLNSKRGCMYRNNLDNYLESGASMDNTSMMDIEEMVKLGHHRKICPYFHSREFSTSSDLVLVPYNYLLDSTIRRTLKLDWDRCIVIFDEAHNLERVASDAASFSLSSTELALCIQEMKQVLTTLKDEQDRSRPSEAEAQQQKLSVSVVSGNSNSGTGGVPKPSLQSVVHLLKAMFELENRIYSHQLQPSQGQSLSGQIPNLPGLVYPGQWLGQLLVASGLSNEQVGSLAS
jgi:regulator of telomere elongation helicase 1